jgi:hypothetical protein
LSLRISIAPPPHVALASAIAELVTAFCRLQLPDPDLAMRVHLAAHELAENLAKYAIGSPASLEVELVPCNGARALCIRTRNRAAPDRIADIEQRLETLIDSNDPHDHYDRLIAHAIERPGLSGLGLARIRAEADLALDYQVEGDEVTVVATAALP